MTGRLRPWPIPPPMASQRPAGLPRLNVACVPGLSGMSDANWNTTEWPVPIRKSVFWNREMVLLRPRFAPTRSILTRIYPAIITPTSTYSRRLRRATQSHDSGATTSRRRSWRSCVFAFALISCQSTLLISLAWSCRSRMRPAPRKVCPPRPKPLGRAITVAGNANLNTAVAWHYVIRR